MNSIGSVTPVSSTARALERNMERYCGRRAGRMQRYMASAMPSSSPVEPIICPTLKRPGVTADISASAAATLPAPRRLFRSAAHASHSGSWP